MPERPTGTVQASRSSSTRLRMRKLRDDFLSLAAHEIRTPITVIKAQAQLASRFQAQGKLEGEVLEKTLRLFIQESNRLERLCSTLLDVARLDSGALELRMSTFDLLSVASESLLKERTRSAYITDTQFIFVLVKNDNVPEQLEITADRDRVEHIFSNILGNAVRYSPEGGSIETKIWTDNENVWTAVSDQGLGIPEDKIGKIFEKYYQAHQDGLRGHAGLGIGLYLSAELIRRMGGSIEAYSQGLGRGTEVRFSLPLANFASKHSDSGETYHE